MIPGTGISIGGEGTERFNSDLVQLGPRLERTGVARRLTTFESFCAEYNTEKDVRARFLMLTFLLRVLPLSRASSGHAACIAGPSNYCALHFRWGSQRCLSTKLTTS